MDIIDDFISGDVWSTSIVVMFYECLIVAKGPLHQW